MSLISSPVLLLASLRGYPFGFDGYQGRAMAVPHAAGC